MTNDKKHATNSGCMPDGGPCEICDEPAPMQELDLDALEAQERQAIHEGNGHANCSPQDVLALIARLRESEAEIKYLQKEVRREWLSGYEECGQRLDAAEQLLRERPKLELYVSQEDVGEEIRLSDFHDYKAWHGLVAEFLRPKAGGT